MLATIIDTFSQVTGGVEKGDDLDIPEDEEDDNELDLR